MKERVKETKKKLDLLEKELAKKEKDVELHDEIKIFAYGKSDGKSQGQEEKSSDISTDINDKDGDGRKTEQGQQDKS